MRTFIVIIACVGLAASAEFRSKIRSRRQGEVFTLSFGGGSGGGSSCTDTRSDCNQYEQSMCTDPKYQQWVQDNCCAFCQMGGTQAPSGGMINTGGGSTCADKRNDCSSYGQAVCTNSQYAQWVTENCPKFCGKCSGSSGGSVPMNAGNTGGFSSCTDTSSNCALLNQASHICTDAGAKIYAQQNCARTCNMCSSGGSSPMISSGGNTGSCTDSLSNCQLYGQDMCNNPNYAQWARENCASFCNLCLQTGGGSVPSGGSPSGGSFTGSSSGCYYKNQLHQQGEKWQDGCDYECTCTDGTSGKYTCTSLCVTWNLPSACHLNPPASGLCCPTPSCPAGYQIKYPPNYSPK